MGGGELLGLPDVSVYLSMLASHLEVGHEPPVLFFKIASEVLFFTVRITL